MIKVLFSNAGRRTYLIKYIFDLIKSGYKIKVCVSDTSNKTATFWVNKDIKKLITPRVTTNENDYVENLLEKCVKEKINLIIPLMDYELPVLAKNQDRFLKIGTKVIISSQEIVNTLLDKKLTEEFCLKRKIKYPKSYYSLNNFNFKFPVIRKRIKGSGSVGLSLVEKENELNNFIEGKEFLQEYIEGQEIATDILNDFNGNYIHACSRLNYLMRFGEMDKAKVTDDIKYSNLSKMISKTVKHVGPLSVDMIEDKKGEIYFIDFNPRFGGGYDFTHTAGCNYLRAIIDIYLNKKIKLPSKPKCITGMKGIEMFYYT